MSEIKVDTVAEKTSANGVTIDGLNIKDSKLVTANSIVPTNLGYNYNQYRNIIINGDMSQSQRGTSASSLTGSGYHTIDRYRSSISSIGTWTQSQSTDVPTGQGFAKSLKMDCTTADASPAAGDALQLQQRVEGQNVQYLKKGTSSAESLTCSFWVKSNKTGTYILEIDDNDNTRNINKSYTISSANTWEKKTITYDGDTTGAFDNDNGISLQLIFWLGAGSTFTSGTLQTSWGSTTNANRAVGQVNLADSTSNEWYVTGVQLEAGEVASDFEFLPVDVNLRRCQRYFGKSYSQGTNPGTNTWTGTVITRNLDTSNRGELPYLGSFGASMRTVPTMTIYSKVGNVGKIVTGSTSMNVGTTEYNVGSLYASQLQLTGIQATVTGAHFAQCHYTADSEL